VKVTCSFVTKVYILYVPVGLHTLSSPRDVCVLSTTSTHLKNPSSFSPMGLLVLRSSRKALVRMCRVKGCTWLRHCTAEFRKHVLPRLFSPALPLKRAAQRKRRRSTKVENTVDHKTKTKIEEQKIEVTKRVKSSPQQNFCR